MKRIRVFLSILVLAALTTVLLCSCGTDASGEYYPGFDYDPYDKADDGITDTNTSTGTGGIGNLPGGTGDNHAAKIIKTANAEINTDGYDDFLSALYAKINEYGGYTDSESFRTSGDMRRASITVRIPADKLEDMKGELGKLGTLTYYNAERQDVTAAYEILVSEVETLELEVGVVEELFDIAKVSGDLAKISQLESRLTELKLRIAEGKTKLKVYDNAIAYSTLYLNVCEVIKEEPIVEKDGAFARIGTNLKNNFENIGSFFTEAFVWLISALPYIVLIAIPSTIVIVVLVKVRKRKSDSEK